MRRRALLGTVGTAVIAGCGGRGTPAVNGRSFERRDCDGAGDHAVAFDDEAVEVTGCIQGRNGCARLQPGGATYDQRDGTLRVTVREVYEGEVCTMALVALGYRYRISFDGGLPDRVVVRHDDGGQTRTVETATR